jgi:hypothetical protein
MTEPTKEAFAIGEDTMLALATRNRITEEIQQARERLAAQDQRIRALLLEDLGDPDKRYTLRYGPLIVRVREKRWKQWLNTDGIGIFSEMLVGLDSAAYRLLLNLRTPDRWGALEQFLDGNYPGGFKAFRKRGIDGEWVPTSGIDFSPIEKAPLFAQELRDGEGVAR